MPDEAELRTASDAFLTRLDKLHELEEVKRTLTPGTPEMLEITREVEALTAEVLGWARRQTELAESAAREASDLRPIEQVPPRDVQTVLREWREAERSLSDTTPGTAGWEAARADVERLRDEYRRAFDERKREPPGS